MIRHRLVIICALIYCSTGYGAVVAEGLTIDIANSALTAAKYESSSLEMLAATPNEDLQYWSIDQGTLILKYSKISRIIIGITYYINDDRPKASRQSISWSVKSFDTETRLMLIQIKKGEQDGPPNDPPLGSFRGGPV